mmetsp:Transcript_73610/g.215724  ORF Transcript_73610/g.215724 Transcript_73610/m.215724 type:complete len:243 (-) Transcript_73610:150-878(-)
MTAGGTQAQSWILSSNASICMNRCTPETCSSSRPAMIALASVSTRTVLSTKGTPTALATLKTGMIGSTSNFVQLQIREGLKITGRMESVEVSLASTARFATRYSRSHCGARFCSTCSPRATSGQPASAALTKSTGVLSFENGSLNLALAASITLKAVWRVILSYVLSAPGTAFEPLTTTLRSVRPLLTSKSRPMAWTTASALPTMSLTVPGSVASPLTQVTWSSCSLPGSGFSPRRLNDVTS